MCDEAGALQHPLSTSRGKNTHKRHHDDKIIESYCLDKFASHDKSQDHHSCRQCRRDDGWCESIPAKIRLVVV